MASLSRKNGVFIVRFRYGAKQFKKSLRTPDKADAQGALNLVQHMLYRLTTGQAVIPPGVDPGDFIVSGGQAATVPQSVAPPDCPTLAALIEQYLGAQFQKATSSVATERTHLNNLKRFLGAAADKPCDRITPAQLSKFLCQRHQKRRADTVKKERMTIRHLFAWACAQEILTDNPTAELPKLKGGGDQKGKFKTIAEIEALANRGGLTPEKLASLWKCLYLSPEELSVLLALVRSRADEDLTHLLHVIPAYTGMRRGEVLRLQWQDINFEANIVTARSRKQSQQEEETSRDIDLHPELKHELFQWREQRSKGQFVICWRKTLRPLNSNEANRAFWQPLRDTSWQLDGKRNWFKFGFHMYRHSFASNLAARGVDARIIDAWMGHQTVAMQKRYRHLFPKNRRAAMESFSLGPATN